MAFLDLEESILEEFAGWAPQARAFARNDALTVFRDESKRGAWIDAQCERYRARRAHDRAAKRASRPPCPHCGAPVERESLNGGAKVPTYCTPKCARAARLA